MKTADLTRFLQSTAWDRVYWSDIRLWADMLKSDGCTGVPDWMLWTCLEHDCHYRSHHLSPLYGGQPLGKAEADYILRVRMQQSSAWGVFYWRSWVRWAGVWAFGRKAWSHD